MATVSLDDEKAKNVLRQVEFYFSDSNLPRDKFLKKTVEESEDGLVSLALICSFSRMKKHLELDAAMKPEEVQEQTVLAVAEVLRKSSSLRVSEDGKRVGRSTVLAKPEEVVEQVNSRTVAASPLPHDVKLEDVESFFAQHAKVNSVRLPRHVLDKRHFCGTALIEFSEEVDANKVFKERLVYAGAELELKPKKEFDAERERKREQAGESRFSKNNLDESYTKGLIVAFKLKSKSADRLKEQNEADKVTASAEDHKTEDVKSTEDVSDECKMLIPENLDTSLIDVNEKNEQEANKISSQVGEEAATDDAAKDNNDDKNIKGSSVDSGEMKSSTNDERQVSREDLKAVFEKFGTVKFIDYRRGEESGYVRFEDPEAAVKARAMAALSDEDGLRVNNFIATIEALTGDAEKGYWNVIQGNQRNRENKGNRGRGGKPYRGGRKFDGKRSHENNSADKRPNKVQKLDDDDDQ